MDILVYERPAKLGVTWWVVLRQVPFWGCYRIFQSFCNFFGEVSSTCKVLWTVTLQIKSGRSSSRRRSRRPVQY